MNIGQSETLTVARQAEFGYFLTDGKEDVLLHKNETDKEWNIGDKIEVFLYTDSIGRIAATTTIPKITTGRYDWAAVSAIKDDMGVFLNIGIHKEILLGKEDLPRKREVWPKEGDLLFITLRVSRNNRIYAKLANDEIIDQKRIRASKKDFNKNVEGYIYRTAKVGSWIYTNEGFRGFIHESERKVEPRLGEKVKGRIINIKEDGTINVSLLPRKQESINSDAELIYNYLQSRNGSMPFGDKSHPDDIESHFQMSKGSFKRALGKLMKEGKIYQENGWTFIKK